MTINTDHTSDTLTPTGGTLNVSGGVGLTTALPIASGGTGQTTANTALNALLPSQTGNATKVLTTDGTNTSWAAGGTGGGVTSVTGTAPIASSGGTTPDISISQATTSTDGYLSSTDWNTFNNKGSGTVTSVSGTGTVNGIALSGTVTSSGSLTLGGTLDLSSPPAIGGTTPNTIAGTNISSATAPTNTLAALALTGTPNNSTAGKVGVLAVGSNFTAADKNIMASFVQNINDYTQIIVQNPNAGTAASADFVVNNDNTTGSGVYGDFGINSSAFTGSGSFQLANATYLYSYNGDLVLGSQTANGIHFVVNNGTTDAMAISSSGVVSLGTALALTSGGTGSTTAGGAYANIIGFTTTATAGGTTTLTNTSTPQQHFTGTSAQTVQLPVTSTLSLGWTFEITNNSTNILTVNSSGGNLVGTLSPGATGMFTCILTSGTTAASWDYGYNEFSVDAREVPQNAQTGNYTLATTDIGKHIYHASGAGAAVYTIPANSSVPFEIGTTFTFVNMSTTAPTIAITTDTMYLAGTGTTGTRTLAQYGVATVLKMTATTWIISGSGLT